MGERVLICGGRNFADKRLFDRELDGLHRQRGVGVVINGGASGADTLASTWALMNGIRDEQFPADWSAHGRAAGPIRNQRMLDEGHPTLVVAFPGGRGTADMIARAEKAGIEVIRVMAAAVQKLRERG